MHRELALPFRRRGLLVAAALIAICAPAVAAEPAAKDFVAAIYRGYVGKDAKGVPLDSPKLKRLLTPGLFQLIEADGKRAAARGEVPDLDGDPFVDAQDWDIASFTVYVVDTGANRAKATIALENRQTSDKKPVTLDLVNTKAGWRIDDFHITAGSVRKLLSKP